VRGDDEGAFGRRSFERPDELLEDRRPCGRSAIKSGGTTRVARRRWSVLILTIPISWSSSQWKVVEEQKVAALVAGSKVSEARLNEILRAAHDQAQ
jgi:hypothetical protein